MHAKLTQGGLMAGNESLEWVGGSSPKAEYFSAFVAVLNQVHPTGASGRLEQRGDFFLGLDVWSAILWPIVR